MTTAIEHQNVYETYQEISDEFDSTRHSVWPSVKSFIASIPAQSSLLEIGCGNGKNLAYRNDLDSTGIDFVPKFVAICRNKGLNVLEGNAIALPFDDNSFDNVISVAVFHHLSTEERRIVALREMVRVLKPGGRGMVVCWAFEQSESKRDIKEGDQYITWRTEQCLRFYHCYSKVSFENYTTCVSVSQGHIWWQKGNWIFEFTK
jgi:ubiquinone/menaquinone biosynthesis C-methylase UbiE